MENFLTTNNNVVIAGDFNLHIDNDEDPVAQLFNNMMAALGLDCHVDFPTHENGHSLDLIFTETLSEMKIIRCTPGAYLSDHCTIECLLSLKKSQLQQKEIKYRKLRLIDPNTFRQLLELDGYEELQLDGMVEVLDNCLRSAIDKLAPLKTRNIVVRPTNPWFDNEMRDQKKKMRKQEKKWRKHRMESDLKSFKLERVKYRQMLKKAMEEKIAEKINECGNDSKKLYTLVNNLTCRKIVTPFPDSESDVILANEFADYFTEKIRAIRGRLEQYPTYKPQETAKAFISKFERVTESEVVKCIRSMASKSCELDAIPTRTLKQVLNSVIEPITRIVNVSLENGIFASKWKTAIVHPILKKASSDLILSNFRPVSNLSFISKVVEKLVLVQFDKNCCTHRLIPDYQSAYRANYSCETALTKIVNDILWAMEHQKVTSLVAIDLSAAFNTVDHDILLSVLEKRFGVRDTCLVWFSSYLNSRYCMVRIRNALSSKCELKCSVPQGSLGGPSMFTVYASTIQSVVPDDIDLHGFTDDHILKNSCRASSMVDERESILSLEATLVDIKVWMDQNRLK